MPLVAYCEPRLGEVSFWNIEFVPILGYRKDRWHFVCNPGIEKAVAGTSRGANFQSAGKIAYRGFDKNYFGIEYYVDAGSDSPRSYQVFSQSAMD